MNFVPRPVTFSVLLDGQPVTWTALAREWYRGPVSDDGRMPPPLVSVVPVQFDVACGMQRSMATALLQWMTTWMPTERLLLEPEIPVVPGEQVASPEASE